MGQKKYFVFGLRTTKKYELSSQYLKNKALPTILRLK